MTAHTPIPGDFTATPMISLQDLLVARARNLTEERARERVLRLRFGVTQAF